MLDGLGTVEIEASSEKRFRKGLVASLKIVVAPFRTRNGPRGCLKEVGDIVGVFEQDPPRQSALREQR